MEPVKLSACSNLLSGVKLKQMPGLNQLKQFTSDVEDLGDEVKLRAQRGEKPAKVPFPEGISEEDDSEDFVLGVPDTPADVLKEKEEAIHNISKNIKNPEKIYLEIVLTRGKIESNVSIALILEHLFIYIAKEGGR